MKIFKEKLAYEDPIKFLNAYFNIEKRGEGYQKIDIKFYCLCFIQVNFKKLNSAVLQEDIGEKYFKIQARKLCFLAFVYINSKLPASDDLEIFIKKYFNFYDVSYFSFISNYYIFFEKQIFAFGKNYIKYEVELEIKKIDLEKYINKTENKLRAVGLLTKTLNSNIAAYTDDIILQGSFGDLNIIENWSDLDVILLLKREIFFDREKFESARKIFKKFSLVCLIFDPLAHHRFDLITPADIDFYSESFLPVETLSCGVSLQLTSGKHLFKIRDNSYNKFWRLYNFINYFLRSASASDKSRPNIYIYKNNLSMAMLIPSLLLQAKEINISKRDSFFKLKSEYKDLRIHIVDFASQERASWSIPGSGVLFLLKYLPRLPYSIMSIFLKFYKRLLFFYPVKKIKRKNNFLVNGVKILLASVLEKNNYE